MLLGFPGETTGDFIKSLRISKHFDATAVFAYCDREGTKSDKMTDKKSQFTVKSRAAITNMVVGTNVVIKTLKDLIVGR